VKEEISAKRKQPIVNKVPENLAHLAQIYTINH